MQKMSKEEKQYHALVAEGILAKTDAEEKKAWEKINIFRKEHPVLVDEIQSRRWID